MKRILLLCWLLFSVQSATLQAALMETYTFSSLSLAVPDGPSYGVSDSHTISSGIGNISSITVSLNISSEYNGDLYAYVAHGSGFVVLLNRAGRTAGNSGGYADSGFNVTFTSSAANGDIHNYQTVTTPGAGSPLTGIWQPDARNVDPDSVLDSTSRTLPAFSSFSTLDADGEWTLFVADVFYGGASTLNSWALEITGEATPVPEPVNVALGIFGCLAAGWCALRSLRRRKVTPRENSP